MATCERSAGSGIRHNPIVGACYGLYSSLESWVVRVAGLLLLVLAWWILSSFTESVRLPSPPAVVHALTTNFYEMPLLQYIAFQGGGIWAALSYTVTNVILGVSIGAVIGVITGAALGRSQVLRDLFSFPLLLLTTVPIFILLPFLVVWFGNNRIVQSMLVIVFTFLTTNAVVQRASRDLANRYVPYARCLGASRKRIIGEVLLPGVLPATVGAIRVSTAMGWSFATVAELIGGQNGTGKLVQAMLGVARTDIIIATVLALGIAAVVIDAGIALVGGWTVRWRE